MKSVTFFLSEAHFIHYILVDSVNWFSLRRNKVWLKIPNLGDAYILN